MEAAVVLAAFARVASCAEFVHGECQCLVGFFADGTEGHGSRDEVFHDFFFRLHLFDGNWGVAEGEEVAQEDGVLFFVRQMRELFEFLVAAQTGGKL